LLAAHIPAHFLAMNPHHSALEDARQAGFDLDMLDSNLALPIAERWKQHDQALEFALALEAARIARDAKLQSPAPPAH
jgi:hypothetical protein